MVFEDKLHDIIETLEKDNLLLAPIEFAWAIVFKNRSTAIDQLLEDHKSFLDGTIYQMVSTLQEVSNKFDRLHPRVDTLLLYHRRPLGIRYRAHGQICPEAICIAFDPYARKVLDLLGAPFYCVYIKAGNGLAGNYRDIHSKVISFSNYSALHKRKENLAGIKPIVIENDEEGNLDFLYSSSRE